MRPSTSHQQLSFVTAIDASGASGRIMTAGEESSIYSGKSQKSVGSLTSQKNRSQKRKQTSTIHGNLSLRNSIEDEDPIVLPDSKWLTDKFLYEALEENPSMRTYEQILTIKSYLSTLDFFKARISTTRVVQFDDLCTTIRLERIEPYKFIYKKGEYADKAYLVLSGQCIMIDSTNPNYEKHKGNAQGAFRGMMFGDDEILSNVPRPICTLNDSHMTLELLSIDKGAYLKFIREAYDVNKPPSGNTSSKGPSFVNESGGGGKGGKSFVAAGGGNDSEIAQIIRILDRPKLLRTTADIEFVSAYLMKAVPFFKQFKTDQMRELCRIVETTSFYDEHVLFKQGHRAEAFFAILSGYVEIWCDRDSVKGPSDKIVDKTRFGGAHLGKFEKTLVKGITFGERSIETEDSLRLSSVVTGHGVTEFLVVPRDAYLSLISVLRNAGDLDRISILRQTNVFRQMEASHLRNFASVMRSTSFNIGDHIYREGEQSGHGKGMTIIVTGECFVETDIQLERDPTVQQMQQHRASTAGASTIHSNKGGSHQHDMIQSFAETPSSLHASNIPFAGSSSSSSPVGRQHRAGSSGTGLGIGQGVANRKRMKRTIKLGRVGPGTILYHFNILMYDDDDERIYHTETVTATTLVHAFVVSKSDFIKLANDTKIVIMKEIAVDRSATLAIDEDTWRRNAAWADFKRGLRCISAKKQDHKLTVGHDNIIDSYRALGTLRYTENNRPPILNAQTEHQIVYGLRSDGSPWHEKEFDYDISFMKKSLSSSSSVKRGPGQLPVKPVSFFYENELNMPKLQVDPNCSKAAHQGIQRNTLRVVSAKHNLAFVQERNQVTVEIKEHQLSSFNPHHGETDFSDPQRFRKTDSFTEHAQPFSLVHVHIETVGGDSKGLKLRDNPLLNVLSGLEKLGGRRERSIQAYIRLSGTMSTTLQARECATAQIQHALMNSGSRNRSNDRINLVAAEGGQVMPTSAAHDDKRYTEPPLEWKQFVGFESVPLQHSDFYIVYCRSAPAEYTSFTPDKDLGLNFLKQPFPAACKSAGQNFALFAARSISDAALATHHNIVPTPHHTSTTLPSSPPGTAARPATAVPTPSSANRPRAKSAHPSSADRSRLREGGIPGAMPTTEYRSPNLKIDTAAGVAESGFGGSVNFLVRNLADKSPLRAPVAYAPIEVPANEVPMENLRQPTQIPQQQQVAKPFDRAFRQQKLSTASAVVVKEESPYFSDLDDDDNDSNVDENNEENKKFGRSNGGMSSRTGSEKNRLRKVKPLVQPERIMLLQEWKSFGEVLTTRPTMAECLSFAATVSPSSLATTYGLDVLDQNKQNDRQLYVCAAPLYEWHLLTEISLQSLDVRHVITKSAAIANAGKRHSMSFGPTIALPNPHGHRGHRKYQMITMPNGDKPQQRPHTAHGDFYSHDNNKKTFSSRDKSRAAKADDPLVALEAMMAVRREIIKENEKICDLENIRDKKRSTENFPSIGAVSTSTGGLANRHQTYDKQHLKLLDSLINTVPIRTVKSQQNW